MSEEDRRWKKVCKSSKLKLNKVKGKAIGAKMVAGMRTEEGIFGTNALCRHMAWPLHWGGKIKDGCLRCPLHQSSYHPEDGSVNEWSPAPYFPLYGKMLGKLRKPSSLKTYEVREKDGYVEIDMNS